MYWRLYTLNCIPLDVMSTPEPLWSLRRAISFPIVFFILGDTPVSEFCADVSEHCDSYVFKGTTSKKKISSPLSGSNPDPTLTNKINSIEGRAT